MLISFETGRDLALHKGNKTGIVGNKGQLVPNLQGVQKCKKFMENWRTVCQQPDSPKSIYIVSEHRK